MDLCGDESHILKDLVDPEILQALERPHTKEVPGVPFSWMVSYTGSAALQNIQYFENGVRHCRLEFPIRVYFSHWTHAIVISFVPIEAIREAHVLEWYSTFYEIPVAAAKSQLEAFPKWPYDGRNADTVRAEMLANGGVQALLDKSVMVLKEKGIKIPSWRNDEQD